MSTIKNSGLCSNCFHASGCMLRTNPDQAALYCEEHFVNMEEDKDRTIASDRRNADKKLQIDETVVKGLCGTCDDVLQCKLPKPESGVWHCEEYR